ncbi:MAG: FtsX-like permease family protein [Acidobacteriota bacterium]
MTKLRPSMGWPLPLLLAARYLKSSRRDAYVSFLSALACGGIALGVAALILVLSGLSGLQDFLRSDVLARTPHLEVELPADADVELARAALEGVPGALGVRLLIRGRGWMLVGDGAVDVRMVGFAGELPSFFAASSSLAGDAGGAGGFSAGDSALADGGVYVGDRLAARWGLGAGDRIDLASARPTMTPFGPQPRTAALRVAGTYRTGQTEGGEARIAVPLASAARLFGERRQRFEIRARGLDEALALKPALIEAAPEGSVVRTWKELNRGLFFALDLEKRLMFVSVFLIVPVAAMALVTALALLISSKRGEVGMLAAMGATSSDVSRAFLSLGLILALGGLGVGGALGIGGSLVLDHFGLIAPPGDVYFIDHVPFELQAADLMTVCGATLIFTFLSTWYAARRAAALRAIEALRGA